MSTRDLIQISDRDYTLLKAITDQYTQDFSFFVFGSRIKETAKKYSDIDIAFKQLGLKSITLFRDEIEGSNLSITVDLVNLEEIDFEFLELVKLEMVAL